MVRRVSGAPGVPMALARPYDLLVTSTRPGGEGMVAPQDAPTVELARHLVSIGPAEWPAGPENYCSTLSAQYSLYVEGADRVSARRSVANTLFLGLHSAVLTVFGVLWQSPPSASVWWLVLPLIAVEALCVAWFATLRSYRQLNAVKYAVIAAMESHLPMSPYGSAEWQLLGRGSDPGRYRPLTFLEQWIPAVFASTYLFAFLAAVATG